MKDKTSICEDIIKYLEANGESWAGKIDDYIRDTKGSKTSNVSRRCRELVNAGILEVRYEQVEGKGPRCAKYRVVESPDLWMGEITEEEYNKINGISPLVSQDKQSKLI